MLEGHRCPFGNLDCPDWNKTHLNLRHPILNKLSYKGHLCFGIEPTSLSWAFRRMSNANATQLAQLHMGWGLRDPPKW